LFEKREMCDWKANDLPRVSMSKSSRGGHAGVFEKAASTSMMPVAKYLPQERHEGMTGGAPQTPRWHGSAPGRPSRSSIAHAHDGLITLLRRKELATLYEKRTFGAVPL